MKKIIKSFKTAIVTKFHRETRPEALRKINDNMNFLERAQAVFNLQKDLQEYYTAASNEMPPDAPMSAKKRGRLNFLNKLSLGTVGLAVVGTAALFLTAPLVAPTAMIYTGIASFLALRLNIYANKENQQAKKYELLQDEGKLNVFVQQQMTVLAHALPYQPEPIRHHFTLMAHDNIIKQEMKISKEVLKQNKLG